MKRLFILSFILFVALLINPANAQVKIGVQAGVNLTDLNMSLTEAGFNTAIRTRAIVGGIITYDFLPVLDLQIEPAYVQKGADVNAAIDFSSIVTGATLDAKGTISANYFEIPILLKLTLPSGLIKPYLIAGGSVAFLLGDPKFKLDEAKIAGQDVISLIPSNVREQTFKLKSTDLILSFGGGFTIPIGLLSVFVEGRYDLGLTDISDGPYDFGITDLNYNEEFKTQGIQIKAGILFGL
jgi:hypothetical protein